MIATLSAVTRERLRRFMCIMRIMRIAAVIGAGVGAVYAGATAGPGARSLLVSLLISIPIGVINALVTASWIASIEIFLLSRASMRWLDALPFAMVFVLKTLVYGVIAGAVLVSQPGEHLLGVPHLRIACCRARGAAGQGGRQGTGPLRHLALAA